MGEIGVVGGCVGVAGDLEIRWGRGWVWMGRGGR